MYKCITNFWPWTGKFKTYHVISICKLVKFFKLFEFLHVFTTGCGSRGVSFTDHLAGGLEDLEGSTETKVSAGVGLLGMEKLDIAGPWMTMDYICYWAYFKLPGRVVAKQYCKQLTQELICNIECFPRRRKSFAVILAAEVTCWLTYHQWKPRFLKTQVSQVKQNHQVSRKLLYLLWCRWRKD